MDYQDQPNSVRPGEELDLSKLDPFLRRHFPDLLGSLRVRQFLSGHSNLTYSIQLGDHQIILRRPPFGSKVKSAHDMGREFRVLSKLHAVYPPAPKVLLYCDDESVLGLPFYLMEPVSGVILRRDPPISLPFTTKTRRRICEAFVDQLARLHGVDYAAAGLDATTARRPMNILMSTRFPNGCSSICRRPATGRSSTMTSSLTTWFWIRGISRRLSASLTGKCAPSATRSAISGPLWPTGWTR